ncbi:MAG: NADH-quinone oxidoreductase subunit NuoE [Bdellovibrionales bacterium]
MSVTQPQNFFFTAENLAEAKRIIAKYPAGKQASALLPLLDLAQRQHKNWLPRSAIAYVADLLDVPAIKAFEVATFYTMFNLEPVGKYLIQLCRTTPCWLAGGEAVATACQVRLGIKPGETTPDGMFTLKEVECLGACVNAPVMQINDDYYEDLTPDSAVAILDALARGDTPKLGSQTGRCGSCACGKAKEGGA